ncbi:MAG: YlbF family regulator [Anaerolineae bacterium]|jgi:cell fate (sporulation/competence/biofilm development) regulator YlbF (YheA/YmcA/DUF963 family)|nr:YlbF family regulator [Anaerolineae bacterium]MDH7475230.1 YlbF family regulator [Anaerolineae bacterium]
MLNQEVETAAREFAALLIQTQPVAELRRAQEQLDADAEAQRLLAEWDQKQRDLLVRQQAGQNIAPAEMDNLRRLRARIRTFRRSGPTQRCNGRYSPT